MFIVAGYGRDAAVACFKVTYGSRLKNLSRTAFAAPLVPPGCLRKTGEGEITNLL
jgi:hypothetical protein